MPRTVPGTAIASMETNSMKPLPRKFLFTTRYDMIIESSAVIGAEMKDSRKESLKAFSPLYRLNTCPNHLKVR